MRFCIIFGVYPDEGITGTSVKKREGFNRMIGDCEDGKINTILTKEVSRFARNTVDTLNYTRRLSQLKVNVIFMNDGINTNDKDGELRLTIMASIAQEESRKISERVKWGMRRKMEKGFVYGYSHLFGFTIHEGRLEIVPEEAEIVKRIFHEYVYDEKGSSAIAKELNKEGYRTAKDGLWRQDAVLRILRNDKYCGDLTQWKQCSTDFLTKKLVVNTNENPDTPVITIENHHQGIVSKETFLKAQQLIEEHGKSSREGKRFSSSYWFSNKIYCGRCDTTYSKSGSKSKTPVFLRCSNRALYGTEKRIGFKGRPVGCDNGFLSEKLLIVCIQHVLEHVRTEREQIISQLMEDVQSMQKNTMAADTGLLQEKIDRLLEKKHHVIDLVLDGIISKDDLKKQVELYDREIEHLKKQISESRNLSEIQKKQLEGIQKYIDGINQTENIDTANTGIYRSLLDKVVYYGDGRMDVYLNCVPFGFRVTYRKERVPHSQAFDFIVDDCSII